MAYKNPHDPKNVAKKRDSDAQWRMRNAQRKRDYTKRWQQENPEKYAALRKRTIERLRNDLTYQAKKRADSKARHARVRAQAIEMYGGRLRLLRRDRTNVSLLRSQVGERQCPSEVIG